MADTGSRATLAPQAAVPASMRRSALQEPVRGIDATGPVSGTLAALQRAADANPDVQRLRLLQRAADQRASVVQRRTPDAPAGSLPGPLRAGIENLSGVAMDGVRVHRNSAAPAEVGALATAQGRDIHLGPGQERHLPHEAWHVVQQSQGRVRATVQAKGVAINDDAGLEAEADVMGARATGHTTPGTAPLQPLAIRPAPVQRVYATLNAMGKARVDQQAEVNYQDKALLFELGMAQRIMTNGAVNAAIDGLLLQLKLIVDAWAQHTGQQRGAVYEHEFGWPPGDKYYGAFEMTAQNITAVFNDPAKPLRMKLKLLYNAVRNNALAKWLKVAGLELDRAAKGQTALNRKVRSEGQKTVFAPGQQPRRVVNNKDETVTPGFAQHSGITANHPVGPARTDLVNTANAERQADGNFSFTRRDQFRHDMFSDTVGWQDPTKKANAERRHGANANVPLTGQNTLTVGDMPDIADPEVDLALKQSGNANPGAPDRAAFKAVGARKLPWSQGGEFYDIELGSDSAREAQTVKARMEAGISGSTDLMLHAAEHLGVRTPAQKQPLRMALAGWMMANRDHSFYEVFRAAVAYGLPFATNPATPGAEYVDATNLAPMSAADFAGVLPNDAPLANVFPADYLSVAWKDHLAAALVNPANTKAQEQAVFAAHGVPAFQSSTMTERDTAAMTRLAQVVQGTVIVAADPPPIKRFAVRGIRRDAAFVYLGNTFGEKRANLLLNGLLRQHHPAAAVVPDDLRTRLGLLGLPEVVTVFMNDPQIAAVEAARAYIQGHPPPPPPGAYAIAPRRPGLAATGIDAVTVEMILETLVRHYYPGREPTPVLGPADLMRRITEVEQIMNMHRTTGSWFSWGPPGGHQANIVAPSLRAATANVPSTQGPGLYIGRKITTSAGYGINAGDRALVINLKNVPTVHVSDKAQMERLRLLAAPGGSADKLESAGLYERHIRAEFLMIYGGGNFGRLTTNQGVTLTMDLKTAPEAELRAVYPNAGLWPGLSKQNFVAQAGACNLDLTGW